MAGQVDPQGRNNTGACDKILSLLAHIGGKVEGMESRMEEVIKELEQGKVRNGPCSTCGQKPGNAEEDDNHEGVGIGEEGVYKVLGVTSHRASNCDDMAMNTAVCLDSCPMFDDTEDTEETKLPATPPELRDHMNAVYGAMLGGDGFDEGGPILDVNARQPPSTWMQRTNDKHAKEAPNRAEDGELIVNPTQSKKGRSMAWPLYKQLLSAQPIGGKGVATTLPGGCSDLSFNLNCPPPVAEMGMGNVTIASHVTQYGYGNSQMPLGKGQKRTTTKLPDIKPRVPGWVSFTVNCIRPFKL